MKKRQRSNWKALAEISVMTLAALRLTRFITTDTLGEWLIVSPAKKWAINKEVPADMHEEAQRSISEAIEEGSPMPNPSPGWGKRSKLVSGLDCPFCVGFWITLAVVALKPLTRLPIIGNLLKITAAALAMNYITGHISARIES